MKKIFSFLCCTMFLQTAFAQDNSIKLISFSSGYTLPLGVENCGDNRLFIVQKTGQIIICDTAGKKLATPFLDISDRVLTSGSEQGLLGVAFSPNYKSSGTFYVNYIDKSGNTQISRFFVSTTDANKADPGSEKNVLQIAQPYANHNGGCIRFGKDGFLYVAMGDGGNGGDPQNNAQNPESLLGKMLRINVNTRGTYSIPPSNPFYDSPAVYRQEIWALGLRNPWRFSFDGLTGALIIADVGQDAWEEVDLQYPQSKGGENYGWRCYEGNHPYNTSGCAAQAAYKAAVYEYPHSDVTGDCSITGGFVYRGKKYPSLNGKYFFADYCSGLIRTLTLSNGIVSEQDVLNGDDYAYTSFGEDKNRELFVTNYVTGGIYRIAPASASLTGKQDNPVALLVYPNPAGANFAVKYTTNLAEECTIAVYDPTGRQIYSARQISAKGDNNWKVTLPSAVKGNCRVNVSSASGAAISHNVWIQ